MADRAGKIPGAVGPQADGIFMGYQKHWAVYRGVGRSLGHQPISDNQVQFVQL